MMNLGLLNPALLREAAPVGGRWINAGRDGIAVTNPATGEVIGHVREAWRGRGAGGFLGNKVHLHGRD